MNDLDTVESTSTAAEAEVPAPDPEPAASEAAAESEADSADESEADAGDSEPEADDATDPVRRPRGFLEADVKRVTDAFVTGEFDLPDGVALTPHRIAQQIKARNNLDAAPSVGAVTGVLKRWVGIGFIEVSEGPFAFAAYTEAARDKGLSALRSEAADAKKAAKATAA